MILLKRIYVIYKIQERVVSAVTVFKILHNTVLMVIYPNPS